MVAVANKRSTMTLFADANDLNSHRVQIVLAEKGVNADVIRVDSENKLPELLEINPLGLVPTLVDRDLILYNAAIITEYLDERFPHPPLMPVYPVARAKCRMMMHRLENDWFQLVKTIRRGTGTEVTAARIELQEGLSTIASVLAEMPFFLSEEFSLVDCCLVTILWRLPELGIDLAMQPKSIRAYAQRLFERHTFKMSLPEKEADAREKMV